jgi:hypothetical protein
VPAIVRRARFDNGDIERIAAEAYREDQEENYIEQRRTRRPARLAAVGTNFVWIAGGAIVLAASAIFWYSTRAPRPSDVELARAHERMLRLAASVVRESIDRDGYPPTSMAQVLPAAGAVQIRPTHGGVNLVMAAKSGTSTVFIPMEAAGP